LDMGGGGREDDTHPTPPVTRMFWATYSSNVATCVSSAAMAPRKLRSVLTGTWDRF